MNNNTDKLAQNALNELNQDMQKALGTSFTEDEQALIKQVASQMQPSQPKSVTDLMKLLTEIGYSESEIQSVLEELNAIASIRILMKIYDTIPADKREVVEDLAQEKLTPMQTSALVELLYKKHGGGDLEEFSAQMQEDTYNAYLMDIKEAWKAING